MVNVSQSYLTSQSGRGIALVRYCCECGVHASGDEALYIPPLVTHYVHLK